jgi:hypothetical protein
VPPPLEVLVAEEQLSFRDFFDLKAPVPPISEGVSAAINENGLNKKWSVLSIFSKK